MKWIKALISGHKETGIRLDDYLHDLKFEVHEDKKYSNMFDVQYRIEFSDDKKGRIISARNLPYIVIVRYNNEVLQSFELYQSSFSVDYKLQMKVDYHEQIFMMKMKYTDDDISTFRFEDMRSSDFIFNYDIENGAGEQIKAYIEEIDFLFTEYGSRKYLS